MAGDEIEGCTADGGGCDWGGWIAIIAQGAYAAEDAEPDHDFVSLAAGGAGAEEGVVGDVGAEGGAGVAVGEGLAEDDEKKRIANLHDQVVGMLVYWLKGLLVIEVSTLV